jgi:hypothetical protein
LLALAPGRAVADEPCALKSAHCRAAEDQDAMPRIGVPPIAWLASVYTGAALDLPQLNGAGVVGLSFGGLLWKRLELEAAARYVGGLYRRQIDLLGGVGVRFQLGRVVSVEPGLGVGIASLKTLMNPYQSRWLTALLLRPRVLVTFRLAAHFELRLDVLAFSFLHNEVTVANWEPTCGLAYRF